MYRSNKTVVIVSIKDRVAKRVLKRIKYMYKNLPDFLKVPVVNSRTANDIGCVTRDTLLVGEYEDFMIGSITPPTLGVIDVSHLQLKVLTHDGTFQRILKSVNKGVLETWEIENDLGKRIRCTWNHQFYTTLGWKTAKEVIEKGLTCIFYNTSHLREHNTPITIPPKGEIIKETRFKGYFVSNLGNVYTTNFLKRKNPGLYRLQTKKASYERVKFKGEYPGFYSVHRLVWETFNGPIPKGYIIDHIDCNRFHNYITNLQLITPSENTKRAYKYSRNLINNNYRLDIDIKTLGRIKELDLELGNNYGTGSKIAKELGLTTKDISQYRRGIRGSHIYVSKVRLIRITREVIVDLEVENSHSYITKSQFINHNTVTEIEFANGSMIISVPTTEDAARSEALSGLVIDEGAIVRWASKIWASSFPTLSTGGWGLINSCVTGDTRIIGKKETFRIDSICPKEPGRKNVSHLGVEVLSHTGKWRRVLGAVNKGLLETWEIITDRGNVLKCTPDHKLLTPQGWKSVKDIISQDLFIITYDTKLSRLKSPPITTPPQVEIFKPIDGFPNYRISNLGRVFIQKGDNLIEKVGSINNRGYRSIKLWSNGKKNSCMVANLVAKAFLGKIPNGYVVDHINGSPLDNYLTNLEIVTVAENTRRASLYSRGMALGNKVGKGFANLQLIAEIHQEILSGKSPSSIADRLNINRSYVTRILNGSRVENVRITKLILNRKFFDTIYDISVEEDESYLTDTQYINHNTPYGVGNWYHSTWVEAIQGSPINPIRLTWDMHPERDQDWYNMMRAVLGPRRTAQEIDGDFLTSGYSVFDLVDIKAIEESLPDYEVIAKRMNGNLLVFEKPDRNKRYYMGIDVSTGRSKDYSAFSLVDDWGTDIVVFKGRIPTDKLAKLAADIGYEYGTAELAPEANEVGEAVVKLLQEWCYPNIYHRVHFVKEKGEVEPKVENIPGWLTTPKNRSVIINLLEEDIRNESITVKDPFFISEAYTFIYDDSGKAVAMGKRSSKESDDIMDDDTYSDDSIMAKAIANYVRKTKQRNIIVAPA